MHELITSGTCKCKWAFCKNVFVMSLRPRYDLATVYAICALSFITSPRWPVSWRDPVDPSLPPSVDSNGCLRLVSIYSVEPPAKSNTRYAIEKSTTAYLHDRRGLNASRMAILERATWRYERLSLDMDDFKLTQCNQLKKINKSRDLCNITTTGTLQPKNIHTCSLKWFYVWQQFFTNKYVGLRDSVFPGVSHIQIINLCRRVILNWSGQCISSGRHSKLL